MKITSIVSLLLLGFCVNTYAQIPVATAPRALTYQVDDLRMEHENGTNPIEAEGFTYYLYMNGAKSILTGMKCEGTVKPWVCKTKAPQFQVGNNLIEITVNMGSTVVTESPKSTQLVVFYGVSQKETIVNTEMQSVTKCQPGSFEMLRITDATKMQAALNASTKHVAYMFATTNAVYAIFCTLLQSGT